MCVCPAGFTVVRRCRNYCTVAQYSERVWHSTVISCGCSGAGITVLLHSTRSACGTVLLLARVVVL